MRAKPFVARSLRIDPTLDERVQAFARETGRSVAGAYKYCADQGEKLYRLAQLVRKGESPANELDAAKARVGADIFS